MRGARLYWQSGHLWPPNYPTTLGHLNNDVEEEEDGDGDGEPRADSVGKHHFNKRGDLH